MNPYPPLVGAMKVLEHASAPASVYNESSATSLTPTPRDVRASEVFLHCMQEHFKVLTLPDKRHAHGTTLGDFNLLTEEMETLDVWQPEMGKKLAQFGNEKQFYLMARTLERRIIVLHGPTMVWLRNKRNSKTTEVNTRTARHSLYCPTSKFLRPSVINEMRALQELEEYPDTLVVQHDGDLHYMCLRRSTNDDVELPGALAKALKEWTPE